MEIRRDDSLAHKIVVLGNTVTWLRNQKMQFMELTASQCDVICYILKNKNTSVTAVDVMDYLQLSQSTVAGILKRLEQKELIRRETDADDARRSCIHPTVRSLELETYLNGTRSDTESVLFRGMSEEEQREFRRLLERVYENAAVTRYGAEGET